MAQVEERVAREFVEGFLGGDAVLERYRAEVKDARLVEQLQARYEEYWGIVDPWSRYNTGRLGYEEGVRLYALVRNLRPRIAVETGVCNGFSTAFVLLGLARNEEGELHSIDLPEVVGADYEPSTFWEGKQGAAIATLAAYTLLFVGMAWRANAVFPVPYQWRRVATLAAAAVGLTVLGKLLDVPLPGAIALALAYPFVLLGLGFYLPAERARLKRLVPILR